MKSIIVERIKLCLGGIVLVSLLAGCATTSTDPRDPIEGWNRGVHTFNENLDQYALKPVAQGYDWIMPSFASTGVTNFFSNIEDIRVTINALLQGKLKQSGMDATRFLINSTIGVAGLFDVATVFDFPKHNEDFDQTLGVWGVPMGPYLVLPFFGPSSPRGATGLVGDALLNPITYTSYITNTSPTAIALGLSGLNIIDTRAGLLSEEKIAIDADPFGDKYMFMRDAYIQLRESLVNDGEIAPLDDVDLDLDDDMDDM